MAVFRSQEYKNGLKTFGCPQARSPIRQSLHNNDLNIFSPMEQHDQPLYEQAVTMDEDVFSIHYPWDFFHSEEFTSDIIIEEVEEFYSTVEGQPEEVRFHSRTVYEDDEDESDVHEQKFMLRFLATNTDNDRRYLWVTDYGEVRTDGSYSNLGTFFEVIHWMPLGAAQDAYQIICFGGACKRHILYMDGTSLRTRPYNPVTDDKDITTKFQMTPRGTNISIQAFISKTGIPLYFDDEGNFRPEGPPTPRSSSKDTGLQPLFFIVSNVKMVKISSV